MDGPDQMRAPRVLLLWAALVVVSVAAHGLVGGALGPGMVVLLTVASAGPVAWLGWWSRPTWVVAPVLAVLQLGWHLGLMVPTTPTSATPGPVGAGAGHLHLVVPLVTTLTTPTTPTVSRLSAPSMTMTATPLWMVLAHVIAGVLVGASLRYGERVLDWLVALAQRPARLWDAVRRPVGSGATGGPASARSPRVALDDVLARLPMWRGPPRLLPV